MARKEKKYHYIYKTTNLLSGRYYIGMHSTDNLDDGYMGSGTRLRRSLNKHGEENHKVEFLEFLDTRKELKEREAEIVNLNEVAKVDCMNLKVGGEGGLSSEEHKVAFINAGIVGRESFRDKLTNDKEFRKRHIDMFTGMVKERHASGEVNYNTFEGKTHTEETKEKMRKSKNVGKANSQYGTCWIIRDGDNKKINKEDLNEYLDKGWVKGRKMK